MSVTETPGSHLARLRVQYGDRWRIDHREDRFTARHRGSGRVIRADSLGELESRLIERAQ
jgi:hypothetical protein